MDILTELMGIPPHAGSFATMDIWFRADPDQVRKLLPPPVELSAIDPGGCNCCFREGLTISSDRKDILVINPERAGFNEVGIFLRCRVNSVESIWSYCLWCDRDFAVIGGWFLGTNKKMGKIQLGFSRAKLFEVNEFLGKVGPGTKFTSFLEAHGDRLVTATMKLSRQITASELPAPLPRFTTSRFLPLQSGSKAKNQLVKLEFSGKPRFGKEIWAAEDVSLIFPESELEDLSLLKPLEITGAYLYDIGMKISGERTVVHEW